MPHPPQLALSSCVLAQYAEPPSRGHSCWPVGHVPTHTPAEHACPKTHAWPQVPQFNGSVAVSAQNFGRPAGEHMVRFNGHWSVHCPPMQTCPAGQALPQLPQLSTSLATSMQRSLVPLVQVISPDAQVVVQLPLEQTWLGLHWRPHMPQLLRSVIGSLQPEPQASCVPEHEETHLPALHRLPDIQTVPQAPQFLESTCRSVHLPLQSVQGTGGELTQAATLSTARMESGRTRRS
jgi:hypothetical protein